MHKYFVSRDLSQRPRRERPNEGFFDPRRLSRAREASPHSVCRKFTGIGTAGTRRSRRTSSSPIPRCTYASKIPHPTLQKALKESRSGFATVRLYDLRHTAATLLLSKGIHPKIVQEILGHSGQLITLDTYSHVLPNMQKGAVRAMEELISHDNEVPDPPNSKNGESR